MRKARGDLSQSRLKEILSYDPDTGEFVRLVDVRRARAGDKCRRLSSAGYYQIGVDGWAYLAHRLAWLYMTGEWPAGLVDHIDGDRINNRWCNLRPATVTQNGANSRLNKNNTSGFKGVSRVPGNKPWKAQIRDYGKVVVLGYFDDPAVAHEVYIAAATRIHGEYARRA